MMVRPDGAFHGTIGGGRLEWEALAAARAALAKGRGAARVLSQALGPDLGQCCGGHVRLLVETFGAEDLESIEALARCEASGPFAAACRLDEAGRVVRDLSPSALPPSPGPLRGPASPIEGEVGALRAPGDDLSRAQRGTLSLGGRGRREAPGEGGTTTSLVTSWIEIYGEDRTPLLLFGAGHVGRALVLALAPLPFRVRWIDTRPDAFPAAMPANVVAVQTGAPEAEIAAAPVGAFALVMTHDHGLDLAITAAALARPVLPFVGLIGSATKRARFERRLRELGLGDDRIAGLACPIGVVGIEGKEPAIIAAATAAQLLVARDRAGRLSRGEAEPARSRA
jgi:xanthine dehydrogenase accessory factor